jgi:hypothetical protein
LRPEENELRATKEILGMFGVASRLQVNYNKTTTSLIRGEEEDVDRVRSILGCELSEFPTKYLWLQLALRPLTRNEWQPILDKTLNCIHAWQRGLIARQERLVLIKSVVMARPVRHLLVADALSWLLEEVVKWIRAFFWTRK